VAQSLSSDLDLKISPPGQGGVIGEQRCSWLKWRERRPLHDWKSPFGTIQIGMRRSRRAREVLQTVPDFFAYIKELLHRLSYSIAF